MARGLKAQDRDQPEEPGGSSTDDRLFGLLYVELRAMALAQLRNERSGHTLNATALVNEVYLRLSRGEETKELDSGWRELDRGRFFGLAATVMRRILVDYARQRNRMKRGGGITVQTDPGMMAEIAAAQTANSIDAEFLDAALTQLAAEHPEAAKVVELRFFAGLTEVAIGEVLGVTDRTVRRHWTFAKAWLGRELGRHKD